MSQPNLFIVGAPKCGTTSLATWLGMHDNVFLPTVKEPHHYNVDHKQVYYPKRRDYLSLYSGGISHRYRLDASVWYLHSQAAAPNIVADCPEAKFIVCLRNPVDMAFSLHSQYLNKTGRENVSSFEKAWERSDQRLAGCRVHRLTSDHRYLAYKYSCRIGTQTQRLLNNIPIGQVHLVVLDDLVHYPEKTLQTLLGFLELPECIPLALPQKNPARTLRSPTLGRAMRKVARIKHALGFTRRLTRINTYLDALNSAKKNARLAESTRTYVTQYFLEEIQLIWELTGTRYDEWTECLEEGKPVAGRLKGD